MSAKVLITGLSNTGKTSLLKTLKNAFVVSHDGKPFPLEIAHTNIDTFDNIDELLSIVDDKLNVYQNKFGNPPSTIAFDSVSRIFTTAETRCLKKYTGFDAWKQLNKQIGTFVEALSQMQEAGFNLVLIAHTTYNEDSKRYTETCKGSFAKTGGFTSIVDYAVNIDLIGTKRIVTHRGTNLARTLIDDMPDSQDVSQFNLQDYIDKINAKTNKISAKWTL